MVPREREREREREKRGKENRIKQRSVSGKIKKSLSQEGRRITAFIVYKVMETRNEGEQRVEGRD